jgi:hypothetical protein
VITALPGHLPISFIRWCLTTFPDGGPLPLRLLLLGGYYSCKIERHLARRPPPGLKELVCGKRVCVTGPSNSVLNNPPGKIESYDLVVRLNSMWPVPPERQEQLGRRCDIWYHVCYEPGNIDGIAEHEDFPKIKFVRSMPHIGGLKLADALRHLGRTKRFPASIDNPNKYLILKQACARQGVPRADFHHGFAMPYLKRMGFHLTRYINTGFFSICELLDCGVTELYVTGITFNYENDIRDYPTLPGGIRVREGKLTHHYADRLFEIFKHMKSADSRIVVDAALASIIEASTEVRAESRSAEFVPGQIS